MNREKEIEEILKVMHSNIYLTHSDVAIALVNAGYYNVKRAIIEFAEKLKTALEQYRFDNEEETENGWVFNSSQFCVDVDCEGGLIDELVEKYINEN